MKKKFIYFLILTLMVTGCMQEKNSDKDKIKIGISYYDSYDSFVTGLSKRIEDELHTYENVIVKSYDAEQSQFTQNRQVTDMIDEGFDVICVNLVDRTAPKKIITMAEDHDVPIIFFNRELVSNDLESWTKLYYVGANASESGQKEAELVVDYIQQHPEADRNQDGKIQYVMLEGESGHQDAVVRTDVSVQTLIDEGIVLDKLDFAIANWNRSQAYTKTKQLLTKYHDEIELILSNNDEMALGAIQALQESGLAQENWPILVGIDGTLDGLQAVKDGYLIGTVFNDQVSQAKSIADLSYALASNQSLDSFNLRNGRYIRHPYITVTKDNVDDYLKLLQ